MKNRFICIDIFLYSFYRVFSYHVIQCLSFFFFTCSFLFFRSRVHECKLCYKIIEYCAYQMKNGIQQMMNALMMIPKVRAAFLSRFIFIIAADDCILLASLGDWRFFKVSEPIPLIDRCPFNKAIATLPLKS